MKLRAPKGEGALDARRSRRLTGGLDGAGRPAVLNGPALRRRRPGRSPGRDCSAARTSTSSCSVICCATRKPTITRCAISRRRFACRSSPPTACASPSRPIGRSTTCSPASVTRRRSSAPAGVWLRNAERYLKPPDAMARLFADLPEALAGDARAGRAARIHDGGSRLPLSRVPGAARGRRWCRSCGKMTEAGARERYRPYHDRARAQIDARARSDREARSGRLLPHRLGHRQFLPAAGHSGAGARLGGQQRRLLQPRHHGGRSGRDGSAVRAVPVGRARRVAGHRSRSAERRSARACHPARLREVRRSSARR